MIYKTKKNTSHNVMVHIFQTLLQHVLFLIYPSLYKDRKEIIKKYNVDVIPTKKKLSGIVYAMVIICSKLFKNLTRHDKLKAGP